MPYMLRTLKVRLKTPLKAAVRLRRAMGCARFVHNALLYTTAIIRTGLRRRNRVSSTARHPPLRRRRPCVSALNLSVNSPLITVCSSLKSFTRFSLLIHIHRFCSRNARDFQERTGAFLKERAGTRALNAKAKLRVSVILSMCALI